jgi:hypothetical protein
MAGRFLVTGCQIGMLAALPKRKDRLKLVDEIVEKQFVTTSDQPVEEDANWLFDVLHWKRRDRKCTNSKKKR